MLHAMWSVYASSRGRLQRERGGAERNTCENQDRGRSERNGVNRVKRGNFVGGEDIGVFTPVEIGGCCVRSNGGTGLPGQCLSSSPPVRTVVTFLRATQRTCCPFSSSVVSLSRRSCAVHCGSSSTLQTSRRHHRFSSTKFYNHPFVSSFTMFIEHGSLRRTVSQLFPSWCTRFHVPFDRSGGLRWSVNATKEIIEQLCSHRTIR